MFLNKSPEIPPIIPPKTYLKAGLPCIIFFIEISKDSRQSMKPMKVIDIPIMAPTIIDAIYFCIKLLILFTFFNL